MHRTRAVPLAGLIAALSLAMSGCGDEAGTATGASDPDALAATSWALVSFTDTGGAMQEAVPDAPATLAFGEDGFVTGNTGCNSFRGSYEADGESLSFSAAAVTMAACASEVAGAQEAAVLAALESTATYRADAEELVLLDDDGEPLLVWAPASTDLAGTRWGVVGVNNGQGAVVATAATEAAEVEFRSDGELAGTTGCRDLTGTYQVGEDDSLTVRPDTTGDATCSPEQAEVESSLLAALSATTTAQLGSNLLTLRDASGATQVTLRRR